MKSFKDYFLRTLAALAAVGLLSSVLASAAFAEEASEEIDARKEFSEANRLASAGAVTRSIPHYEKVLEAAPQQYPRAYYNLAEVWRFKKECDKAVILYRAYMINEPEGEKVSKARSGIHLCSQTQAFGTLEVDVSPDESGRVAIGGYEVGHVADIDGFELLPGNYTVEGLAEDYEPESTSVRIKEGETQSVEFELEKKLFFGEVLVEVDQEGAQIKIEPKDLDSPKAEEETRTLESPMEEAEQMATGKYFLEVTKPGYDRWIRNIEVRRDEPTTVDVRMTESLPEAIRRR